MTQVNTKFYTFIQNNSGGRFEVDEKAGIGTTVIIEAIDLPHAQSRAEQIGLYFDGCERGLDCSCCGDRWYTPWEDDVYLEPSIYGESVYTHTSGLFRQDAFIHRIDGKIEHVKFKP
jgi:hypothetical protein